MDINLQAINEGMFRAALFGLAVSIIGFIAGIWMTYAVLKAAIRDGIKESGLRTPATVERSAPAGYRWALVKDFDDTKPLTID